MREFELIRHVRERSADLRSAAGTHIEIAPGDDMAMLRVDASPGDGGVSLLASTDQVVDGRHVDLRTTSLELVGRKTLTRCLSDVAAMAVRPIASLVSVVLPASMTGDEARVLFDAMQRTAGDFAAPLIGGDVASHARSDHPLTCSTTVLAVPGAAGAIERRGARVGDRVYVTGRVGGSLASGRHLTFEPRIDLGLALADALGGRLHAMIDLSDGLGRDADHVAEASGVHLRLDGASIPRNDGVDLAAAIADGEDYELLFTAEGSVPDRLLGTSITAIGMVHAPDPAHPRVVVLDGEDEIDATAAGWEHGGGTT